MLVLKIIVKKYKPKYNIISNLNDKPKLTKCINSSINNKNINKKNKGNHQK